MVQSWPPDITTNKRYLDFIFSITQVDLVGAISQGCHFVTFGRLRCFPDLIGTPIATGARLTLPLTLRAMVHRPDAPLIAVQSSYEFPMRTCQTTPTDSVPGSINAAAARAKK